MAKRLEPITIIRDTREKEDQGWFFEPEEKVSGKIQVLGTQVSCLDAADYSLLGYEDQIRIERKAGFQELFGNMCPAENKDRFEREMEKLREIPFKYLIVETNLNRDSWGMSIPQMYRGPNAGKVFEWLIQLQQEYNITPLFTGDCGKKVVRRIFETFIRKYGRSC